jgi:hypothetical protein
MSQVERDDPFGGGMGLLGGNAVHNVRDALCPPRSQSTCSPGLARSMRGASALTSTGPSHQHRFIVLGSRGLQNPDLLQRRLATSSIP